MFLILNRLRGTYSWFAKINGVVLGLLVYFFTKELDIAIACAFGYIIGESFGWGDWVGTLSERGCTEMPNPYNEGENNGIKWLASKIISPSENWTNHCRVALFIRGLYWWVCLLPLVFFIEWYFVLLAIVILAFAFPLACELGYYTSKLWNFKYMTGGWEHQEVWYGLAQDIVILILLLRF